MNELREHVVNQPPVNGEWYVLFDPECSPPYFLARYDCELGDFVTSENESPAAEVLSWFHLTEETFNAP